jgi:SHOCT-like protein
MNEEVRSILDLLAQGKITVDEAHQLIEAVNRLAAQPAHPLPAAPETPKTASPDGGVQFLRVRVNKAANSFRPEKEVNIRVPVSLMSTGMKLGSIIQGFGGEQVKEKMRERGIDLSKLDEAKLREVLKKGELLLDVEDGKSHVQVTCE